MQCLRPPRRASAFINPQPDMAGIDLNIGRFVNHIQSKIVRELFENE